ncbi:MAG TPA: hypothetical protein VLM37_09120 [Fibrobacteraceae bacterium]|nr:hypothetical protein [Fibrobacteraceae bacterium]
MLQPPRWLGWAERHFHWLTIPNLGLFLVALQTLGFAFLWIKGASDPYAAANLAQLMVLDPQAVLSGEIWRIFTFLTIPLSNSIWMIFVLWFLYFVLSSLAQAWGDFKLTIYFLIAWLATVVASLLFRVPVDSFLFIETTFFFALATLIPDYEILFFFLLPIKIKWVALFSACIMILVPLLVGDWAYRLYVLVASLNYLLFFGPAFYYRLRLEMERRRTR